MQKDYYHILQVPPSASHEDIKRAFRRLALKYHPDVLAGGHEDDTAFTEIYEAYHVLSDPILSREYRQKMRKQPGRPVPLSAAEILGLSAVLREKTAKADPYRIDRDMVRFEILYLLTAKNLKLLSIGDDLRTTDQFIRNVCDTALILSFPVVREIAHILRRIEPLGDAAKSSIEDLLRQSERNYYWNRYKVILALGVALAVCLFIYFSK